MKFGTNFPTEGISYQSLPWNCYALDFIKLWLHFFKFRSGSIIFSQSFKSYKITISKYNNKKYKIYKTSHLCPCPPWLKDEIQAGINAEMQKIKTSKIDGLPEDCEELSPPSNSSRLPFIPELGLEEHRDSYMMAILKFNSFSLIKSIPLILA